jgi:hypothetical protein
MKASRTREDTESTEKDGGHGEERRGKRAGKIEKG